MIGDLSGVDDDDDGRPPVGPALMPGAKVGPRELLVLEEMCRKGSADFPGSVEVSFTAIDEETGEEIWDPPVPPDFKDEGIRWQKIMAWPRVPTIAEAQAFQINARLGLQAAWWTRLAAAKAEDDAR